MAPSRGIGAPGWGWGTARQIFACRLSHALGLVVVLGMLVAFGWSPSGRGEQVTVAAAPLEPAALVVVADDGQADGRLVHGAPAAWRDDLLLERSRGASARGWTAIRTPAYTFVRYDDGHEELYDLIADPNGQKNVAHSTAYAAHRADLAARLDALLAQ